jgi:hypothetical protein
VIRWVLHHYLAKLLCKVIGHNVEWLNLDFTDYTNVIMFYCTRCTWWEQDGPNSTCYAGIED